MDKRGGVVCFVKSQFFHKIAGGAIADVREGFDVPDLFGQLPAQIPAHSVKQKRVLIEGTDLEFFDHQKRTTGVVLNITDELIILLTKDNLSGCFIHSGGNFG